MHHLLKLIWGDGQFVQQADIVGGSGCPYSTLMRLNEEVKCERVRDRLIDDEPGWQVTAPWIDILILTEEAGTVSFGANTDEQLGSIGWMEPLARFHHPVFLVDQGRGVLSFGDAVTEDEDPFGELPIVVLGEDAEVRLDHIGEVLDDIPSAFLQSDLSGVAITIGIVGGNGARYGRGIVQLAMAGRLDWV